MGCAQLTQTNGEAEHSPSCFLSQTGRYGLLGFWIFRRMDFVGLYCFLNCFDTAE